MSTEINERLAPALAAATLPRQPSGADLRAERAAQRVSQIAQAAAMGISRQRLYAIEWKDQASPELVERYRRALASIPPRPKPRMRR